MSSSLSSLLATLACAVSAAAFATGSEPPAGSTVTAVQSPAWLVHDNSATPLKPGMRVNDGDTLRTAVGGRVYVALPEQSTVKLGENTEFTTPGIAMTTDAQGSVYKGVLHILKGVFRFTTSLAGKSERRELDIQLVTATIGIRGTDVWGRAGKDGGLVALLEGKISMDMPGHPDMKMDQPMHYMLMPTASPMQMNLPVTPANVADWAAQTDVAPGTGVLTDDGRWLVALTSSPSATDLAQLMKKLANAGYPVEDITVTHKGHDWHRLAIRQAASYKDAKSLSDRIVKLSPDLKPWIYEQKQAG